MNSHQELKKSIRFSEWTREPHKHLGKGKYKYGTLFLLRTKKGHIHICSLGSMMKTDQSCRALRLSDFKYIRLENYAGSLFSLIEE